MNIFIKNAKKIVVFATIAASFSGIFVRLINAGATAIGFYRLSFAVPFFAVAVLLKHRAEMGNLKIKQVAGGMLGGLFLAGHYFSLFTAVNNTTIASAFVICNISPIIILIITALIFREKTTAKAVIGVIIALTGAAIITGGDYSFAGKAIFGDAMAFLAALFYSLYFLVGREMRKQINAPVYVFIVFTTCWMVFLIGMFVTGTPFTGYSTTDFVWLFVFAMVCSIGAHAVFNWCLAHVSPLYISTIETGEAIFAAMLAALLFGEIPTLWQWIGGGVTICGLLYYNFHEMDAGAPEKKQD
jgi:drug/metabolite transporter (DMT)-like permease